MVTKIKIKKKIKELRESAKGCLEQRACLGRGYRGYTDELLQAKVLCNGKKETKYGGSPCQSRAGLLQKVVFRNPVKIFTTDRCASDLPDTLVSEFKYQIALGRCQYLFADPQAKQIHKHVTFGYDGIMLRSIL